MAERLIKSPGPDHPMTIENHAERVVVSVDGTMIADTRRALVLREADYPRVFYVPRDDVDFGALVASKTASYCPYKGHASYFSIPVGGARAIDAVWSYEAPHAAAAAIQGHLAFYPDRVDIIG